ncbi:permease [Modicisalibacter tunisiensis]|uniref:permease n=1 Tax=Modicisalibacter tunisiensis TaxID=390637 RepID=UPI001CCD6DCF|nr:permease [Modicisalibacter tunisiensis]MBZ9539329.1 permease [Modicisalibacter tunisiensis]
MLEELVASWAGMVWEIFWGLALGFLLSGVIRAWIPAELVGDKLGRATPRSLSLATGVGALSSSCSYAAASMARTLIMKGAAWANAMAFMVASTNLVFEILIVLFSLLGLAFVLGELVGGLIFIVVMAVLVRLLVPDSVVAAARENAGHDAGGGGHEHHHDHGGHDHDHDHDHDHAHDHEGHEGHGESAFVRKLRTAASHFHMDVTMVGKDILIGVTVAAILSILVPNEVWRSVFLTEGDNPGFGVLLWNAVAGSIIAVLAFVCSVGNIVLAAVLWKGGISFGGVIAFILSDLITLPMLSVYRRYYGWKAAGWMALVFFLGAIVTALCLDYGFALLGWLPEGERQVSLGRDVFGWNYVTLLNVVLLPVALAAFFWGRRQGGGHCH